VVPHTHNETYVHTHVYRYIYNIKIVINEMVLFFIFARCPGPVLAVARIVCWKIYECFCSQALLQVPSNVHSHNASCPVRYKPPYVGSCLVSTLNNVCCYYRRIWTHKLTDTWRKWQSSWTCLQIFLCSDYNS